MVNLLISISVMLMIFEAVQALEVMLIIGTICVFCFPNGEKDKANDNKRRKKHG
ncbi:MAG: hypothetical protein RSB90_11430 [Eubacterium sp.]